MGAPGLQELAVWRSRRQGCSLISGLLCRRICLLALMVFADGIPIW